MKKLALMIILLISITVYSQEEKNRGYRVKVGQNLPELQLNLTDGSKVNNQTLKGKVTILQFTASWCSVCRKEMPHLEKEVWQRFKKNKKFQFIGIDLKETPEKVAKFRKQMQVTYPFAIDKDGKLFKKFTLPNAGVTRNIVVDQSGKIIFLSRLYEEKEFANMVITIEKALAE
ncbi:MAG: TlpA family protein disulfide reductase [Lutibacter sp.]